MNAPEHRSPASEERGRPGGRRRVVLPLVGAIVFLGAYLAVDVASAALADGTLPLPGAPAAEVAAYLTANTQASLATGLLQALSVAGLALVVAGPAAAVASAPRAGGEDHGRRTAVTVGVVAVVCMLVSAALSVASAIVTPSAGVSTLSAFRDVGFLLGGVGHVVALGVFVWLASRARGWTRPVRVLGAVAAVPAVLSVLSLVAFPANALLPLGRLLCMVWTVSAGVSLARERTVPAAA